MKRRTVAVALRLVLAATAALAVPAIAKADTIRYASPASTDTTGACADPQHACEIVHAINDAPSATIIVAPGVYDVSSAITVPVGVSVEGDPSQPRPEIVGSDSLGATTVFNVDASSTETVRHLDIQPTHAGGTALELFGGTGETIEDLVLGGPCFNCVGARIGRDATLRNIAAVTLSGDAVWVSDALVDMRNVTALGDIGLLVSDSSVSTVVAVRNVIARGTTADLETFDPGGHGAHVNITYSNYDPAHAAGSITDQGHNQSDPPALADPLSGDVHELAGSPTIDAGNDNGALGPVDFDGDPRTFGSAPDIGADEYVPPPAATTGDASNVGTTSAMITGSVQPNATATSYRFEYGTSTGYGSSIGPGDAGAGTAPVSESATLSSLAPGTTYHYRLVATNAHGTGAGADRTFTTAPAPGGGGGTGAPDLFGGVVLKRQTVRVVKGAARVAIGCPASTPGGCTGKLTLRAGTHRLRLGSRHFAIPAGHSARVRVKISRRGLRALRRTHKLTAKATASARDGLHTAASHSANVKLVLRHPHA